MNESDEINLISACQSGNKDAFRILIENYKKIMFGTAYLITRDYGLAEDIVQETLIQMWKNLPSLRLHGSLKAWIMRILINESNKKHRKKQIATIPLEDAPEVINDGDNIERLLIHSEEHLHLRKAVDRLPSDQREAIILRYFSELTVPEIASVLGQKEGTIKSRLSRSLDQLRRIISDDEIFEGRMKIQCTEKN